VGCGGGRYPVDDDRLYGARVRKDPIPDREAARPHVPWEL
jgi:hypothetical protein